MIWKQNDRNRLVNIMQDQDDGQVKGDDGAEDDDEEEGGCLMIDGLAFRSILLKISDDGHGDSKYISWMLLPKL